MNQFTTLILISFCQTAIYPQFFSWVCVFVRVCCFMYSMQYISKETKHLAAVLYELPAACNRCCCFHEKKPGWL